VIGGRLALNDAQDTAALLFAAVDTDTGETIVRLEAERRLGESFKLTLEGLAFINSDDDSLLSGSADDSSLRLILSGFW